MDHPRVFAQLARIAREAYDRIVGLVLANIAVDGCITKAPGGDEVAGPSPGGPAQTGHAAVGAGRRLLHPVGPGTGRGQPHDSPLLGPTLDRLADLGPLPDEVTVHLDASYDSGKTRARLDDRGPHGEIAHKGEQAPIQATRRWYVERTNAWHNAFNRFQRCHERREA